MAVWALIQSHQLDEKRLPGQPFCRHRARTLKGNNDLLVLTQPDIIAGIHRHTYLAGADR